ncbi:leucyl aminopeptidase [Nakamurella panacisegetis]|uniref:Probable cytosol aminopeptidase n=1 Tax=Nakamurella panacisegetis TaxID=1090615 RepID=A0A1H0T3L3_9ACTN|nr:leucyl aminopeptidase [Nakamurella panacisegetis]SDP48381.1 leucyl aminopeptidase [Nakamurella panacisegetis]
MTTLSLTTADPAKAKTDVLVVAAYAGPNGPVPADQRFADAVSTAALTGASGKAGELTLVPGDGSVAAVVVAVVGLGAEDKFIPEVLRKAAGIASRGVAGKPSITSTLGLIDLTAAAEGHLLGGYVFDRYKTPSKPPVESIALSVTKNDKATKATLRDAVATAEGVLLARDLINTAPNDLFPQAFAERATAAAEAAGLSVEVFDENQLAAQGFGGILAVGSGSSRPPRLVRVAYSPKGATKTVALVGKGITFDSGGLSIKPAQGMENMTSDMSGAACVVATVIAAAALRLPVAVTAWAAMAENLPSGSSYRPGDVIRHYGAHGEPGKTVHVLNTDAEGRLVLADAIVRAAEEEPDYLIETSTLTGAQVVALGNRTMAVMGSDDFRDRVAELAREVGEGGWSMPLPEELGESIQSQVADLQNINWDRVGGMLVAGHYLSNFVPDGLPWAHLDVAGPAFNSGKPYGYNGSGGTGVPVRTLLAVLADIAAG